MSEIPEARAKTIIKALIDSSAEFEESNRGILVSYSSKSFSKNLILDLFQLMNEEEHFALFESIIREASNKTLPGIGVVINLQELGYGRFVNDRKERNYKIIFHLENLLNLENLLLIKQKKF